MTEELRGQLKMLAGNHARRMMGNTWVCGEKARAELELDSLRSLYHALIMLLNKPEGRGGDVYDYLECPCCGVAAAMPDEDGCYYDGQPIECGCVGLMVSADEDEVYISGECERDDEH